MSHHPRHATPRRVRGGRIALAAALTAIGVGALSAWDGASAAAPDKFGWWDVGNAGAVAAPAPPDVPAKGLYVENGFNGPTAISALTFAVPSGAQVGGLTLQTAGSPVITSPPVACPLTSQAQGYQPAEDGAWSAHPAYDCTTKVVGVVSSDQKTVTFSVGRFVHDGVLAIALLAGGSADRVPFATPAATALAVTVPATGSGALPGTPNAGGGTTATSPAGAAPGVAPVGNGLAGLAAAAPADPASPPAAPDIAGAPAAVGLPPVTASSTDGPAASETRGRALAADTGSSGSSHRAATAIGLAAVVAALVFWSEGFGVLGGRVTTFTTRRRTPAPAEETVSDAAPAASVHS